MGRQVEVFMIDGDFAEFYEAIGGSDVAVLAKRHKVNPVTDAGDALLPPVEGESPWVELTPRKMLRHVVSHERGGYFHIDPSVAPVLEMHRPRLRDGELRMGRLYDGKPDLGALDPIEAAYYHRWVDSALAWLRRHYRRMENGRYSSGRVQKFVQQGGNLAGY